MTATFSPQDSTTFTAIRYYTQFDPYFYSVDNRPLQDIETNLHSIAQGGSDAARRACLINALGNSASYHHHFPKVTGTVRYSTGLDITTPSSNVIQVNPGAVYESRLINDTDTTYVVKQAMLIRPASFTFTPPVAGGTSIVYTIEGQFADFSSADQATSTVPYVDSTNAFLPSSLLHGELKLQVNSGIAATSGSEVPATTTSGWFPLFNITYVNSVANPVVWSHANAPAMRGITSTSLNIVPATTGGATQSITQDALTYSFPDAATSGVVVPVTLYGDTINPYKPIKLKLSFSPSVTGGNISMRIRYKGYAVGDLLTTARTISGTELMPITTAAGSVQSYVMATAVIPNTEFSGFVNGSWSVIKERVTVALERIGADAGDTNTGVLNLLEVVVFQ